MERMKNGKRFVRYKEGAEMYSMCQSKFEQMAKDAKAIYKVDKLVLVNCDIFEEYLETFRLYVCCFLLKGFCSRKHLTFRIRKV